ncbi:hypothetical protein VKT23_008086 [Stygiomarasmius scandens]|uniref:RING-type E3 ubiquitin transferase n=1 Tax=Marasmiellus scandens TaxID=2682957 RepID=A0ABR1IJB0_9AGAR
MDNEYAECRICRDPPGTDKPLFHPCKCKGSIEKVHQDCVQEWLTHSKKTTCDLCGHPFTFTKEYVPGMPTVLPPMVMALELAQRVTSILLFTLRVLLMAVIWLLIVLIFAIMLQKLFMLFAKTTFPVKDELVHQHTGSWASFFLDIPAGLVVFLTLLLASIAVRYFRALVRLLPLMDIDITEDSLLPPVPPLPSASPPLETLYLTKRRGRKWMSDYDETPTGEDDFQVQLAEGNGKSALKFAPLRMDVQHQALDDHYLRTKKVVHFRGGLETDAARGLLQVRKDRREQLTRILMAKVINTGIRRHIPVAVLQNVEPDTAFVSKGFPIVHLEAPRTSVPFPLVSAIQPKVGEQNDEKNQQKAVLPKFDFTVRPLAFKVKAQSNKPSMKDRFARRIIEILHFLGRLTRCKLIFMGLCTVIIGCQLSINH